MIELRRARNSARVIFDHNLGLTNLHYQKSVKLLFDKFSCLRITPNAETLPKLELVTLALFLTDFF